VESYKSLDNGKYLVIAWNRADFTTLNGWE